VQESEGIVAVWMAPCVRHEATVHENGWMVVIVVVVVCVCVWGGGGGVSSMLWR
jgi:hypothetical protein